MAGQARNSHHHAQLARLRHHPPKRRTRVPRRLPALRPAIHHLGGTPCTPSGAPSSTSSAATSPAISSSAASTAAAPPCSPARALKHFADASRNLYLYDTFAGMTDPTPRDIDFAGRTPHDHLKAWGAKSISGMTNSPSTRCAPTSPPPASLPAASPSSREKSKTRSRHTPPRPHLDPASRHRLVRIHKTRTAPPLPPPGPRRRPDRRRLRLLARRPRGLRRILPRVPHPNPPLPHRPQRGGGRRKAMTPPPIAPVPVQLLK